MTIRELIIYLMQLNKSHYEVYVSDFSGTTKLKEQMLTNDETSEVLVIDITQ